MNNQTAPAIPVADLNRVVAYNLRVARSLRGWTQEELADRLAPYLGRRLTQASVSALERAHRRAFDANELLIFALVFDLPITWFLFPPPSGNSGGSHSPEWLLERVFGNDAQARSICERLSEFAAADPQAADRVIERLTGHSAEAVRRAMERDRQQRLRALIGHADDFDAAVETIAHIIDQFHEGRLLAWMDIAGDGDHALADSA